MLKQTVTLLFFIISFKAYSNPHVDSFINANACFFVRQGLPLLRLNNFKLLYKNFDRDLDSNSIQRRYKSYLWENQCEIYSKEKSTRKEDIIDFRILNDTKCNSVNWFQKIFGRKNEIEVFRIPPIKEDSYTYCYYIFHYGNSYMHVVFKLFNNEIVRFCYSSGIS